MKIKLLTVLVALGLTLGAKAQSYVSLWNIQYSTVDSNGALPNSPYAGTYVKTGGIITAVQSYGYYIQTSYATKWAAVSVYDKKYKPKVGDSVAITAQVIEYYNETELDSVKALTVINSGNQALTPPTLVAFDSIQRREYQAMLIKVKNATCVRYNTGAAWWVFSDSTTINSVNCEDTIDNIIMVTQVYTPGQKYNITGVIHLEYANWIEPRNANDIEGVAYIANNAAAEVTLYPNPNQGEFTAMVNASVSNKNSQVILTDVTGRVIYKEQKEILAGSNTIPVNISNLAKGTYFLQISNTNYSAVKKVIVQ